MCVSASVIPVQLQSGFEFNVSLTTTDIGAGKINCNLSRILYKILSLFKLVHFYWSSMIVKYLFVKTFPSMMTAQ